MTAVADALVRYAARTPDPLPPPWPEWTQLSPEAKLPFLLRALPDCDGDPRDILGFGGGSVWRASQRVPPDAPAPKTEPGRPVVQRPWTHRDPSGRSAADGLCALGDVAIPALIDRLTDRTPTRCVATNDEAAIGLLDAGACAWRILDRIIDDSELRFDRSPDSEDDPRAAQAAAARAWWANWSKRGGLVGYHRAVLTATRRALAADPADPSERAVLESRRAHHTRWLAAHGDATGK